MSHYDVSKYTDEEIYSILDLNAPSDRELEAKILSMVRKYSNMGTSSGEELAQFFVDIYNRFFEEDDPEAMGEEDGEVIEGMETIPDSMKSGNTQSNPLSVSAEGTLGQTNVGNRVTPSADNVQLTKPLDYAKDKLNPLLKQSIKRIISIDSQYRENKNAISTQFTFNLSEPLKDVVSLSLYSIQLPYAWHTVNSNFGGNFFYLKGNSPGIDNGNHDYKISVPSGNYDPATLVSSINTGIATMAKLYPDVSFGSTRVVYNNGIASSQSGTGKSSIYVDITKIYNEGNYYLEFPNWTSPDVSVDPSTNAIITDRFNSIAGYLGFNDESHGLTSIYSNFIPGYSTSEANNLEFTLTDTNSTFQIIPYVGNSYLEATTTYSPIFISLGTGTSKRRDILSNLDNALKTNSQLDPNFSFCTWVNVTGETQYNYGSSYIEIACKLNRLTSPIVRNLKLAILFPVSSDFIFTSDSSCFRLPNYIRDASQNVICELNDIISDNSILQSNYVVTGTNEIHLICSAPGYSGSSLNHYSIPIPESVAGYALNDYLTAINTSIQSTSPEIYGSNGANTNIYLGTDDYLYMQIYVRKSFTNIHYKIQGDGLFTTKFGFPEEYVILTSSPPGNVFKNPSFVMKSTYFSSNDTIIISPLNNGTNPHGNDGAPPFVIRFDDGATYSSLSALEIYLNNRITSFVDGGGRRPFINSKVEYVAGSGFVFTINVQLNLTQNDYVLKFNSDMTVDGQPINSWYENLDFNTTPYNLSALSNSGGTYSQIRNNELKSTNKITLGGNVPNYFTLKPYSSIDGLQTSNSQYDIRITIPNGEYSIVSLVDAINAQFTSNSVTAGSLIQTIQLRGQLYTKFRLNINKVFTTADYRLVFYDPISFVSCFTGANRNSNQGVSNATWDTTLGWLIGFRKSISYNLGDYTEIQYYNEITDYVYYLTGDSSNICVLNSDTAVNTNLYNYFLISLDDYVQNHLNDGLITITNQETSINHAPAVMVCDPATGQKIARPADYGSPGVYYTDKQLYAFNEQVQSNAVKSKSYSKGPFVQDIFGIIPIKPGSIGSTYVEFGGTLQNQQRIYFGPVNIHRMTIRLLNDRGDLVDLNGANWSFSLICEQLYRNGT